LSNLISQARDQGIQIEVMDGQTDWTQLQYDTLAQWVQSGVEDA
jgi:hypothetical protein